MNEQKPVMIRGKSYCDDPDKESGVAGEYNQHGQLHHPEVQGLLLAKEATVLDATEYITYFKKYLEPGLCCPDPLERLEPPSRQRC